MPRDYKRDDLAGQVFGRRAHNFVDRTGHRYNRLLVLGFHGGVGKTTLWDCICDCGKRTVVRADHLRTGDTKSCGCLRATGPASRPNYKAPLPPGLSAKRRVIKMYRGAAIKRGLSWDLSEDQVFAIIGRPCHYCGVPSSLVSSPSRNGRIVYNGMDRVDNALGYNMENVVPCCNICNHAKHTMGYDEFIAWIRRAVAHLGLGDRATAS